MAATMDLMEEAVTEARPTLHWNPHQAGVWVAYQDERFVGMVEECWGSGFTATTSLGRQLGSFLTIDEAKSALEEAALQSTTSMLES